jgi:DNA-binding Xre family transcriptional regulator
LYQKYEFQRAAWILADLTPNTVARFAKGEPVSLEIIERLCKALECTPNDIFEVVKDET